MDLNDLSISTEILGSGAFATVYKGVRVVSYGNFEVLEAAGLNHSVDVAVKMPHNVDDEKMRVIPLNI